MCEVGGKQSGLQKGSLNAPREHTMPPLQEVSRMIPRTRRKGWGKKRDREGRGDFRGAEGLSLI